MFWGFVKCSHCGWSCAIDVREDKIQRNEHLGLKARSHITFIQFFANNDALSYEMSWNFLIGYFVRGV
jgi:hypothetical protein